MCALKVCRDYLQVSSLPISPQGFSGYRHGDTSRCSVVSKRCACPCLFISRFLICCIKKYIYIKTIKSTGRQVFQIFSEDSGVKRSYLSLHRQTEGLITSKHSGFSVWRVSKVFFFQDSFISILPFIFSLDLWDLSTSVGCLPESLLFRFLFFCSQQQKVLWLYSHWFLYLYVVQISVRIFQILIYSQIREEKKEKLLGKKNNKTLSLSLLELHVFLNLFSDIYKSVLQLYEKTCTANS